VDQDVKGGRAVSPSVKPIVNDVTITVATSNGTGSQSANLILMRAIFNMGIPVSGKNMFPSNIQGLPTWFTVRANEAGWTARKRDADIFIAMNVESIVEDVASLRPGAVLIVNKSLASHVTRTDLHVHVVPFDDLVVNVCKEQKLRKMVVNILYVGVLAHLLDVDMESVKSAITHQFAKKAKAAALNTEAAVFGYEWAKTNLNKIGFYTLRQTDKTKGKIVIEGNQAAALGLVFGGIQVLAWYPITPSSSLCESAIDFLDKHRRDEKGKATYATIQAEDELASIAMVAGAGWAGARAATGTAGPGISLMSEIVGLMYFAEIPGVIIDVQRMGPSTGLPTRTCQGDIFKAYHLSHGDCKHPLLLPANPIEEYLFSAEALDLAERLQTIVFVMTDLDLGMNNWMSDPFPVIEKPIDRGKVLSAEDITKRGGVFQRYKDLDGDAICYRTIPGTNHPNAAYFTRGTGHTESATYSERPHHWKDNMDRLSRKFETIRKHLPRPVIETQPGAQIGIIAYGSTDPAMHEARAKLTELGVKTDYLRLRALPIDVEVREFIANHKYVYIVEQNRDAQAASILQLDCPEHIARMHSILHYSGLPIDAQSIVDGIQAHQSKEKSAS
jgi:2-oxoglutarate ferredoxin oxidoreductase subunit alpha